MTCDRVHITFKDQIRKLVGNGSVSSFARKCGMGESLVRQYLTGTMPRLDKMVQISEANNVTLDWLATGRGPKRPGENTKRPEYLEYPVITDLKLWVNDLVKEDPGRIEWFRIELQEKFKDFKKWREKNRNPDSPADQASG